MFYHGQWLHCNVRVISLPYMGSLITKHYEVNTTNPLCILHISTNSWHDMTNVLHMRTCKLDFLLTGNENIKRVILEIPFFLHRLIYPDCGLQSEKIYMENWVCIQITFFFELSMACETFILKALIEVLFLITYFVSAEFWVIVTYWAHLSQKFWKCFWNFMKVGPVNH